MLPRGQGSACSAAVFPAHSTGPGTEHTPISMRVKEWGLNPACHAYLPSPTGSQPLRTVRKHSNKVGSEGVTGTCENPSQMTFFFFSVLPSWLPSPRQVPANQLVKWLIDLLMRLLLGQVKGDNQKSGPQGEKTSLAKCWCMLKPGDWFQECIIIFSFVDICKCS